MKTLEDYTIIYDSECPLCNAYTSAFIKTGMLDIHGRQQYTPQINQQWLNVDPVRARNEIALVNKKDNTVHYGIDSLFKILGYNLPVLAPLFRLRIFRLIMTKLYFFISYNRKVIAPGVSFEERTSCTPEFNVSYRCAYLIFAWLMTSIVLVFYARLAVPLISNSNLAREFLICGGQLLFQGAIVGLVRKDRLIHYLGNMMTVSLIGALLLAPMFLLTGIIQSPWLYSGYFMLVVAFMFAEHARRTKTLALPWLISLTWVLYRFIVLGIITISSYA